MNKDIQQLQKARMDSLMKHKEELLKKYIKNILESVDIDKHLKSGKLNTNGLITQIKNELNKVVSTVNNIK